jgi:hypothetical protein
MLSHRGSFLKIGAIILATGGVLASNAKAQPAPAMVSHTVSAVAVVESVDQTTRQVVLRDPSGELTTVTAGPGVHNLAQVHAGDHVRMTYKEAVAAQLSPPGGSLPAPSGEIAAVRAARGQLPAGALYSLVHVHVRINAVDQNTGEVSFTRADGSTGALMVKNPKMLAFARQLKPGDQVEINYLQALTIKDETAPS